MPGHAAFDVFDLPPEPRWPYQAACIAVALLASISLAWWQSMAWDVVQGRTLWVWAALTLLPLLWWARLALRAWGAATGVLRGEVLCGRSAGITSLLWSEHWPERASHLEAGHASRRAQAATPAATTPWRLPDGRAVQVKVLADIGHALLLALSVPEAGEHRARGVSGAARVQHRWVSEADLPGPWRWRLISATLCDKQAPHRRLEHA